MTLFTNSPYEKMMIQKPGIRNGINPHPLMFPHAAGAAPTWGSPRVSGTVSES